MSNNIPYSTCDNHMNCLFHNEPPILLRMKKQREYIFYCIVIIEKGTNSPTHINLSVIPTGWVLVSYTHKAITEEFFKSANQSNSCIMQNLENSLTKQPIVSLLKQRFLKDSIP